MVRKGSLFPSSDRFREQSSKPSGLKLQLKKHLREGWIDIGEDTYNYMTSGLDPPTNVYKNNSSFYNNKLALEAQ